MNIVRRRTRWILYLAGGFVIALLHSSCASTAAPAPTAAQLARLEARQGARPASIEARLQLAAAYHDSDRHADVVTLLEPVSRSTPSDPAVLFLLASAYESANRYPESLATWRAFLESGGAPALNRRVRARIAMLERRALEAAVRSAIAQEQALAATAREPRTVGVFPFLFRGSTQFERIGTAMAEMLATDLAQTDRLTIVERTQIQFLFDELQLAETGRVDTLTAARFGRLLGAGRLVQGSVDEQAEQLRLGAVVVAITGPRDSVRSPLRQQGALSQLFDLEKELALSLYAELGIQLTIAERERVLMRHTDNVQALLAFGFGLEADDAGRWSEAVRHFERAVEMDGGFALARNWLENARLRAEASGESDEELAESAELELGWDLPDWLRQRRRFRQLDPLVPWPDQRNPLPEMLGIENVDQRARAIVIVRPPRSE